jgi:hypothetical protein
LILLASLRSHYNKPVISIHIRRSPISSVGQLSPTSSMSAENDATTLRVDISPSPTNGSSPSLLSQPITPIESTSTYAMVKNNNDDSKIKSFFRFDYLESWFIEYCRSV